MRGRGDSVYPPRCTCGFRTQRPRSAASPGGLGFESGPGRPWSAGTREMGGGPLGRVLSASAGGSARHVGACLPRSPHPRGRQSRPRPSRGSLFPLPCDISPSWGAAASSGQPFLVLGARSRGGLSSGAPWCSRPRGQQTATRQPASSQPLLPPPKPLSSAVVSEWPWVGVPCWAQAWEGDGGPKVGGGRSRFGSRKDLGCRPEVRALPQQGSPPK